MAKTTIINEREYTLHGVKVDSKSVGQVPVPVFKTLEDIADAVDTHRCSIEWIVSCLKYGMAVSLQKDARNDVTGEKFGDKQFNQMFNRVDKDILLKYQGDYAGLRNYLKSLWEMEQRGNVEDYDREHVFENLAI